MTSGQSDAFHQIDTSPPRRIELMGDRQEADIEQEFCEWIKKQSGYALKLIQLGTRGFPDRTVLLPGGRCLFVEFKRPGGSVSKHQDRWIAELTRLGFEARVFDDAEEAKRFVRDSVWK